MDVDTHLPAKVSAFLPKSSNVCIKRLNGQLSIEHPHLSLSDLPSQGPFSTSNLKFNMVSTWLFPQTEQKGSLGTRVIF